MPRGVLAPIVLGVAPGLSSVSYAVVAFSLKNDPRIVDYDVLIGTRPSQLKKLGIPILDEIRDKVELAKRFNVHRLTLEVICERHHPFAVAIGPPARTKEPASHVEGARLALRAMAILFDVPVFDIQKEELQGAFSGEKLLTAVQRRLEAPIGSSDRRIMLAAGAAMVAAAIVRNNQGLHSVA